METEIGDYGNMEGKNGNLEQDLRQWIEEVAPKSRSRRSIVGKQCFNSLQTFKRGQYLQWRKRAKSTDSNNVP
jgi:hypothetical protein